MFSNPKFRIFNASLFLLISLATSAQGFGGYEVSTYSGVLGVKRQPAVLARMPYKVDGNVLGASANILIKDFIPESSFSRTFYENDDQSLSSVLTNKTQNYFVNATIYLPSAAIRINDISAVSFNWKVRAVGYGTVSNGNMSILAENGYNISNIASKPTLQSAVGVINSWQEFGLTYSRSIYSQGRHRVDAGITANYLVGGGSGFIELETLDIEYDETTNSITNIEGSISLTYNDNIDNVSQGETKRLFTSSGFGFDFGVAYEYLDDKHLNNALDRKFQPNYLLRFSSSFTDVGRIYFDASENSAVYKLGINQPINSSYFKDIENFSDFSNRMKNIFDFNKQEQGNYELRLPTNFNFNTDYNVWKDFYINGLIDVTFIDIRENIFNSPSLYSYQLSGRYEKAKYGFYASVDFDKFRKWGSSFSFRYSFLYLGIANVLNQPEDNALKTFGFMIALKVPLLYSSESGKKNFF